MAYSVCAPSVPAPSSRPRRPNLARSECDENQAEQQIAIDQVAPRVPVRLRRSEEWLHRRFINLEPGLFYDGPVLFYTAQQYLRPPVGFENVWAVLSARHVSGGHDFDLEEHQLLRSAHAIVMLVDTQDSEQMDLAFGMADYINENFGDDSALLVLAPHTCCPEIRKSQDEQDVFPNLKGALDRGIDEVIIGEPEGMKFAWEVKNRLNVHTAMTRRFADVILEEDRKFERAERLQLVIEDLVWDYARARLGTGVPVVDTSIAPGIPDSIGTFDVGELIGKGACGRVHRLSQSGKDSGLVLKALPKANVSTVGKMRAIKQQVKIMELLSKEFTHPNITKLHQIYHSETHLLMVLEDGGQHNLFQYLMISERDKIPIPACKTEAIIVQIMRAVYHMHIRAQVAHLDLKPENILVAETDTNVSIKITDFDTSQVNPNQPLRGTSGTFPFSAPEIDLDDYFDGYAADMWSLGVVILEVLCRLQLLESVVCRRMEELKRMRREQQLEIQPLLTKQIRKFFSQFGAVNALLQDHLRPELRQCTNQRLLQVLPNLLDVNRATRLRAEMLATLIRTQ